ncbi:MAG: hypothetical protein GX323_10440 [Clostridiales bacterium]|nr:hypothetical protein [Clostridiales bacterium]
MKNKIEYDKYTVNTIRIGITTCLLGVILSFGPPLYLYLVYGAIPPGKSILSGYLVILSMFGISYFTDMIAFYPVAGLTGIYMGYFAGNMSGLRLPVMLAAREALGINQQSEPKKAEIVGTIAMGASVFVSVAATSLVAIIGPWILSVLPQVIIEAFDYASPAIMGTLVAIVGRQDVKRFVIASVLAGVVLFMDLPALFNFPLVIFASIAISLYEYKKHKEKAEEEDRKEEKDKEVQFE